MTATTPVRDTRPETHTTHHPLTVWLIAAQFGIFGVTFATISVLWKDIIAAVGISEGTFGRVLAVMPVAGVPVMLLGGYLGDRVGPRLLPLLGTLLMPAFCLALLGPPSVLLLLLAAALQGVGSGIFDVGVNTASVEYERQSATSVLNALHACFNAGAVTAAILTGVLRSAGVPYRGILAGLGALYLLMLLATWRIPLPAPTSHATERRDWRGTLRALWANRMMRLVAVILCCGLVVEGTMGTWAPLYLRTDIGLAAWIGGVGYALFNVTMTIGRFSNQRLLARIGPRHALIGAGIAMVAANALTLATRQAWLVVLGFALLGIAGAGVFPTGFVIVGRVAPGAMGLVSGVLFALAYLVWAGTTPVVGGVADALSLRVALVLLGVCGALIALCGLRLPHEGASKRLRAPLREEAPPV